MFGNDYFASAYFAPVYFYRALTEYLDIYWRHIWPAYEYPQIVHAMWHVYYIYALVTVFSHLSEESLYYIENEDNEFYVDKREKLRF